MSDECKHGPGTEDPPCAQCDHGPSSVGCLAMAVGSNLRCAHNATRSLIGRCLFEPSTAHVRERTLIAMVEKAEAELAALRASLADEDHPPHDEEHGCSSHSCLIATRTGSVVTNGPCTCIESNVHSRKKAVLIERALMRGKMAAAEHNNLRHELCEARDALIPVGDERDSLRSDNATLLAERDAFQSMATQAIRERADADDAVLDSRCTEERERAQYETLIDELIEQRGAMKAELEELRWLAANVNKR